MRYDLSNPTRAARIIYDGAPMRQIAIAPGETVEGVELTDAMAERLIKAADGGEDCLLIEAHDPDRAKPTPPLPPALVLDGRYGIGDAIHQRGVIRELMRDHQVWLQTCHFHVYQDLVERGLKLIFKDCRLHAQAKTIARERGLFPHASPPPAAAPRINLSYNKGLIDQHGSILEAMAGCCAVKIRPLDFSLPVRPEWTEAFRRRFSWNTGGKPIMVYRPIVLRREWNGANRNPDPTAYRCLFEAARDGFFVVSVADLKPGEEWIVGIEPKADVRLHGGELTFEDMAALWREAAVVFCNAGFAPVLAQAVGTPSIIVYGGRECYRTTQRAGEHLAPTLGLDRDVPCDCMNERHGCGSNAIALPPAMEKVTAFVERIRDPEQAQRRRPQGMGDAQAHGGAALSPDPDRLHRPSGLPDPIPRHTLIFATTYVDSGDREKLTRQWLDLHTALNPDCDFLIVDSHSPRPVLDPEWAARFKAEPQRLRFFDFGDNVGHLSRRGRDGWGRAFCRGLDYAVEKGYAHVLHIEGDSLLRVPARDIVAALNRSNRGCATIPVKGTQREIPGWIETGLMCFSTDYLRRSRFTAEYNWPIREVRPTPEFVVAKLIKPEQLLMLSLKGLRGDKNQISAANIVKLDLDWVTHCHSDIWVYDEFVKANLPLEICNETRTPGERLPAPSLHPLPATIDVAVVVGGAPSVFEEIAATDALLAEAGATARWFVINDMIPRFERPCTAVTLHPHKLADSAKEPGWLAERERKGLPRPVEVWAHVKPPGTGATHFTEDWRGSSGLFAVKVALKLGFTTIVLCGVPMDAKAGHFVRGATPWKAVEQFLPGWRIHKAEIAPHVRSWSGWTAEMFGRPDRAFLGAADKVQAA